MAREGRIRRQVINKIRGDVQRLSLARAQNFVNKVYDYSQETVPVVTGRLKRSWWSTITKLAGDITIRFGYKAPYARFVDWRRKFFTDALNKAKSEMVKK
jgi:hypothetical protein